MKVFKAISLGLFVCALASFILCSCSKDEENGSNTMPILSTQDPTDITSFSAVCGGNVEDQGSSSVTTRGVCWSTSSNPTTSDSHTNDGSGTGSYTSNITGLDANTSYYVRAYATNSEGTAYGNQKSFTTSESSGSGCNGITSITDPRDGQIYPTVEIGDQCWLQKNMNYATGNSWCYDNNTANCATYGRLYDWETVMNGTSSSNAVPSGVQGICPPGWHVPSDAEWTILTDYLGGEGVAGGNMKEAGTVSFRPFFSPSI
jgi:hypothetical protein